MFLLAKLAKLQQQWKYQNPLGVKTTTCLMHPRNIKLITSMSSYIVQTHTHIYKHKHKHVIHTRTHTHTLSQTSTLTAHDRERGTSNSRQMPLARLLVPLWYPVCLLLKIMRMSALQEGCLSVQCRWGSVFTPEVFFFSLITIICPGLQLSSLKGQTSKEV